MLIMRAGDSHGPSSGASLGSEASIIGTSFCVSVNLRHQLRVSSCSRQVGLADSHPLQVEREDLLERLVRVFLKRCTPVRACVVDKHMQALLALGQLSDERLDAAQLAEVRRERDARSWASRSELGSGGR